MSLLYVFLNCQFNMELFNMQRSDLPAIFGSPTNVRVQFFCNNKKENPYCGRTMIANKCNRPEIVLRPGNFRSPASITAGDPQLTFASFA